MFFLHMITLSNNEIIIKAITLRVGYGHDLLLESGGTAVEDVQELRGEVLQQLGRHGPVHVVEPVLALVGLRDLQVTHTVSNTVRCALPASASSGRVLTSQLLHLEARWMQKQATTVGRYCRHMVVRCRLLDAMK